MFASLRKAVLLVLAVLLLPAVAVAQLNRTAVSVTGSDAASCAVPDPCRTFAVALSRTNPNGEVVALTSGGYGPFTIDKPATIVAAPGIYAALVAASGDAIHVNAGAGAKVVIRGLHLYGMGTGNTGISVTETSEEVHVEHCVIDGFTTGILASLNVRVSDTTIRNGAAGILIENATAAVKGTINRVEVRDMFNNGIRSSTNANVTVRDSVAADCVNGFQAVQGQLNIENSLATNNSVAGVRADNGGTVRVSNTMATDNGTGFASGVSSTFGSWGNNKVRGNTTDKSGTITVISQTTITIAPSSPTVGNCIPFGNGGSSWSPFAAFFYRNVPPFTLSPGDMLAFDLGNPNNASMQMDIAMAATTVNGGTQGAQPFQTVVPNTQSPASLGDTTIGNFEVAYTVGAPFSFAGGGLIIRFGNSSAAYQLDTTCTAVLVSAQSTDPSGFFVGRAFSDTDGIFPWTSSDTTNIGGFRLIIATTE